MTMRICSEYAGGLQGAAQGAQNSADSSDSMPAPDLQNATSMLAKKNQEWVTVVHNDPVNLMTYVQWIFESYFNMDSNVARLKMLEVHRNGRAVVAHGGREQMERDAQAMHTYGLWATIEPEADGR
ncbi:ATP-dependent Clp protease adapter ClpS [Arcanobacterium hippocoleae]|uniref:ATP-dependent Clp protease adapter ClpS n=1 Tax=Arcanobacterium hippocoleae TaxID=149017 RepID=UPI003DA73BF8